MHLVIVAGGLGSRLAPLTDNIPKLLVNIGKNTGYVEMIRYWKTQIDFAPMDEDMKESLRADGFIAKDAMNQLTVIVHSKYAAMVSEYHKLYFPEIPLIVKCVDEANGSAHAILSSCEHVNGEQALFAWCDIIPTGDLRLDEFTQMYSGANVVFTNYNNSNRYELVRAGTGWADMKVTLSPTERGGCFGLYYVNNFRTDVTYKIGQDFIDIIDQYGKLREHRLERIIDFGDMPKLRRTQEHADEAREFNSVEFIGNEYVLKQATNAQGKNILKREIAWYKHLDELLDSHHARPAVPRTWIASDGTGFFMDRVEGVAIWKAWPDLSPVDRSFVVGQLIDQRRWLFRLDKRPVGLPTLLRDVEIEAHSKLLDRYKEIRGVIASFGNVRSVNGYELRESNPEQTIHRLFGALQSYYTSNPTTEYGFIHGDLQFSNSMVDTKTRRVTIIDPRGYFGKSELIGLEDYDIGKLLYALSGYDTFNCSREFFITLEGGHLHFDIPHPSHDGIREIMQDHFKPIHQLWLAVCWIGLAQYIKNDPVKSLAAHYHGLALAEKALIRN
jgi:hypothetical protein